MATDPGDPLNALVITAMMQALDEQKRDQLIRKALEALVTPERSSYDRGGLSQLERAFNDALRSTAHTVVAEMVNTDEIRAKVRELAARAFEKMLGADMDKLAEKMSSALVDAMTAGDR